MDDYACMFCDGHHGPERGLVNCVRILADRVKELESKLGVVEAGLSTDREAVGERPITTSSPPAAPSVSAEDFKAEANYQRGHGATDAARACDLAAAVTEWLQRHELDDSRDGTSEQFLFDTVFAFVRGEPLPQRGK